MADFSNLLDEVESSTTAAVDNPFQSQDEYNDPAPILQQQPQEDEEDYNADDNTEQQEAAQIPSVLLQAETQYREERERDTSALIETDRNKSREDGGDYDHEDGDDRILSPDEDYETLKHLWIQELNCAELLPYHRQSIPVLMELLSAQEEIIDDLQDQGKNSFSASSGNVDPSLASLAASVAKMDLDRVSFLLADLTRTRLGKIEKYALHNREVLDRMSDEEISYLKAYGELYEQHMRRSVTDHIPKEAWRKLDEPSMIERPNLDAYVFCYVVDEDGVVINNHEGIDIDDEEELEDGPDPEERYDSGAYLFVRYGLIRNFILEGRVELLM